jgi:hypothetical protein
MAAGWISIVVGLVTGVFAFTATYKLLGNFPATWIQDWLKPRNAKADERYLRRASKALTSNVHSSLFLPFAPVIIATGLMIVLAIREYPYWMALAACVSVAGLGSAMLLKKPLREYRRKVSSLAARQLVRRAKPEEAGAILIAAANHQDAVVRLAAVEVLRELGTNSGIAALKKLAEDQDASVVAAARDAMDDLIPALKGSLILSVRTMETYVEEHKFLGKQFASRKPANPARVLEKLTEITQQIDEIVYSQLSLRRAYPDVFCEDCLSRAEDLQYEEWEWVRCKHCKEVHGLRAGVRKVVGQIGGELPFGGEGKFENGVLRVTLWDAEKQKARYGEVDVLEVIGGQGINYDWAISAVIEKMHNQGQGRANMVSVKLTGKPVLEVNTLHLLRTLDPGVMGGEA